VEVGLTGELRGLRAPIPKPRDVIDAIRAPRPATQSRELAEGRGAVAPPQVDDIGPGGARFDELQGGVAREYIEVPASLAPMFQRLVELKRQRHQLLGEDDAGSEAEQAVREAQATAALLMVDLQQRIGETRDMLRPGGELDPMGREGIIGLPDRFGNLK
jgi:hypothetical protein